MINTLVLGYDIYVNWIHKHAHKGPYWRLWCYVFIGVIRVDIVLCCKIGCVISKSEVQLKLSCAFEQIQCGHQIGVDFFTLEVAPKLKHIIIMRHKLQIVCISFLCFRTKIDEATAIWIFTLLSYLVTQFHDPFFRTTVWQELLQNSIVKPRLA